MNEATGLYSLRRANRSVRIGALLFLLVLGYAYVFAFLMVREFAGLTPEAVSATYAPDRSLDEEGLPDRSVSVTQPLDLSALEEERHTVDTRLLIQDSHIHILMFAVVAALLTLIVLGLEWRPGWRDTVIVAAFAAGALDFSGQWLMKAGLGGFAWLTILSGWTMAAVYLVVLAGTVRATLGRDRMQSKEEK
ncbi:MAG: hypothetical protein ACE5HP_11160 [Gemmatimonadota bacterium]